MLELLAIAPEDGWAYVRSDNRVYLVRPPYTPSNRTVVDERTVERAVQQHGFDAATQVLADWADLVGFLNDQVRRARSARGQVVTDEGIGAQILQFAPAEVLGRYLDRVEAQLLPCDKWDPAERLLSDMLSVEAVQQDRSLLERVSMLLKRTCAARQAAEASRQALAEDTARIPERFPRSASLYGEGLPGYLRRISTDKQLFAIR